MFGFYGLACVGFTACFPVFWDLFGSGKHLFSRFGFLGTGKMAVSTWTNKETMHDSASETEARTKNVPACGTSWVSGKETLDKHTGHEVTERRRLWTPAFDLVLSDTSFTTGTPDDAATFMMDVHPWHRSRPHPGAEVPKRNPMGRPGAGSRSMATQIPEIPGHPQTGGERTTRSGHCGLDSEGGARRRRETTGDGPETA